ncbi:unnamed protein product [Sphagnum jensenii]|uniref:Fe2OG dioxygenase domain-containing protein n=1 Tax=Sphagnum jensenii TaxID=128206 RepID=A0ABP1A5K8_9BRYO
MGLETEFPSEFQTPVAPPTVYVDEKEQPWDVKEGGELKVPESFVWPDAMQPKVAFNEYVDVPLIDLAPCHTGDEIGIQKVVKEVDAACREWGAFQVINHGIPDDVVLRAREAMKRVFHLPPEIKLKAQRDYIKNYNGFGAGSMLCPSKQWSEAFQFLMTDEAAPAVIDDYGERLFGDDKEFFCNAIKEYLIGNDKVRLLIWDLVIKGLKVKNESFFKKYLSGSVNKGFRSNYYPPCPDPSKVVGLVVHTDSTLGLVQLGDVGGYQLMKDGVWMSVNPRKGENTLCINIGDYIEVMSNNQYKSVIHRVVTNTEEERISIDCVAQPPWDFPLSTCPELIDEDHPQIYKPIIGKEYQAFHFRNFEKPLPILQA